MSEFDVAHESPDDIQLKWKQLGDLALALGQMDLALACAKSANDLSGLLLMYTSYGDRNGLRELQRMSRAEGKFNIAFACAYSLADVDSCVDLLLESERVPEAALFARTYVPSRIAEVVAIWKRELAKISEVAAASIADPTEHPEGFPDLEAAIEAENLIRAAAHLRENVPASNYPAVMAEMEAEPINMVELIKSGQGASIYRSKLQANTLSTARADETFLSSLRSTARVSREPSS